MVHIYVQMGEPNQYIWRLFCTIQETAIETGDQTVDAKLLRVPVLSSLVVI